MCTVFGKVLQILYTYLSRSEELDPHVDRVPALRTDGDFVRAQLASAVSARERNLLFPRPADTAHTRMFEHFLLPSLHSLQVQLRAVDHGLDFFERHSLESWPRWINFLETLSQAQYLSLEGLQLDLEALGPRLLPVQLNLQRFLQLLPPSLPASATCGGHPFGLPGKVL